MKLVKNEEDLLPKLWKPSATAETPNGTSEKPSATAETAIGTSGSLPRPRKPPTAHREAFRDRGNRHRHIGKPSATAETPNGTFTRL